MIREFNKMTGDRDGWEIYQSNELNCGICGIPFE